MKKFLYLKHWQLFLLLFGIPLFLDCLAIPISIMARDPFIMIPVLIIISVVCFASFFAWLWAMGVNLHAKLPPDVPMNLGRFKIFLLVPIFFCCVCYIPVLWIGAMDSELDVQDPMVLIVFVLLSFFAMYCIFYCLYFVAKALKAVELQRPVTFRDFAGEFLLLWFYIIGIWVIQPKMNVLFSKKQESAYL